MSQEGVAELAGFAPARGKLTVLVAGLLAFAGLAGWVLWITPAEAWAGEVPGILQVALWAAATLCPLCAADHAVRLLRHTPTLVATPEGLALRGAFGVAARLRWQEISLIAPVEMGRKVWLAVYLNQPHATLGHLGVWTRLILVKSHAEGEPNFALRAIQLGAAPEHAAEALERIRQGRHREPAGSRRRRGQARP